MGLSPAARNDYLDRIYGGSAPGAVVEVGFLDADPDVDGVELDDTSCPGYERFVVSSWSGFWPTDADLGVKTSLEFTPADATDAWDKPAAFEGIWVDGVLWDWEQLDDPITPSTAGPFDGIQLKRLFLDPADL